MRDFVRRLFRVRPRTRGGVEAELREEIDAHVALATEHLIRRGTSPDDAARLARERFGQFDDAVYALVQSATRRESAVRRQEWWDAVSQDARIAVRQLRNSPGLTAGLALTLALGIGANLVMFDFVDRALLTAPPGITDPGGIRRVIPPQYDFFNKTTRSNPITNFATYRDMRAVTGFAGIAAFGMPTAASRGLGREASRITVNGASASFFTVLGVQPFLGRFYSPSEDEVPAGTHVAVVSYGYWLRAMGGDRAALGRSLMIDAVNYIVVGVAPPSFNGVDFEPVDAWLPMTGQAANFSTTYLTDHGSRWMMIVARLAPGADERRVIAEASDAVVRNDERIAASNRRARVELGSVIAARGPGPHPETPLLLLLFGVTGAVLLIACANAATLLLSRAVRRQQEVAIRLALGASRWRLLEQFLIEAATIAVLATGAAWLGMELTRRAVQRFVLPPGAALVSATIPHTVGVMTTGMVVVIVIATLAPALDSLRVDVTGALKGKSRSVTDSRLRVRGALLVAQVAVSTILLVGAGLFVRSLHNAEATRVGIDVDRVLLAQVDLTAIGLDVPRKDEFWQAAVDRVGRVPHVVSASRSIATPMRFSMSGTFIVPGRDSLPALPTGGPYRNGVDERFFVTTGARILRGRGFTAADSPTSQRVIVINETMATRLWPNADPIGACVRTFRADTIPCATIVGVVEDVHRNQLREGPSYQYYLPYSQWLGAKSAALLVRLDAPSRPEMIDGIRRALQDISSDTPFPAVHSYAEIIDPQLRSWKLGASVFSLFGALAFLVAMVGLYALLAYSVAQRRFELGVRAALGATGADLIAVVSRRALTLVLTGLGIGLIAAFGLGTLMAPLLLDVSPHDQTTYGTTAIVVLFVTVFATMLPARRAATADPMQALRSE